MPINRYPSVVWMYLQRDINHTVYMSLIVSAVFFPEIGLQVESRNTLLYFSLCSKRGSQLLDFQWISNQSSACSLCKNICSCQATSYSACPLAAAQATDLTTENKRLDISLTLWDCPRPFIPHRPILSFSFFFSLLILRCGLLSSLTLQSRGKWSIIKIVMGSGSEVVRKPTSLRDMLKSCCEKQPERGKRARRELRLLNPIPSHVIHANKPHQQHWHQWYWLRFSTH